MKHFLFVWTLILLWCPVRLAAQTSALQEDEWLLGLVSKQGEALHKKDSIYVKSANSLWLPLYFEPLPVRSLNDTVKPDPYSIQTIRSNARRYVTTHHADLYKGVYQPGTLSNLEMNNPIEVPQAIVSDIVEDNIDRQKAVHDLLSPWRRELNLSLQLTQNFASDNWYQGGNKAFALLASAKGFINYRGKKLNWDNTLEWRAGYTTVNGDSLHKGNTTDDVFRLYSKLGIPLHPQVFGSMFAEFKTNLWRNWKKNERFLASDFMTPLRYTMGLGIDYKPMSDLSVNFAPLTYKMVFALKADPATIDVTAFGIEEGKNILNEIGSSVRLDWTWRPLREIQLETDFYFYTNYHRIETELELTCNFIINRFMSAKVMCHPRYDSSVEIKEGRKTKLQFKEFISVGFAHTFR